MSSPSPQLARGTPDPEPGRDVAAVLSAIADLYTELHHSPPAPDALRPESQLERDLGFDSLGRVELLHRIERSFDTELADETLGSVETIADLVKALGSAPGALAGKPTAGAAPPRLRDGTAERSFGTPTAAATLTEVLEWHVAEHPQAIHCVLLGEGQPTPLTYAALHEGALGVAGGLRRGGVQRDATVALMLPTAVEYLHAFFGVLLAGAIPVPIYPPTRPSLLEEHIHRHAGLLGNAGVDALITFHEARIAARLLQNRVPSLRHIWSVADLRRAARPAAFREPLTTDSIAMLQYTSGSTGAPKGVILSHADLLANIRAMGKLMRATSADVFVSWLPLYHDMGLIGAWLGSLYFGCLLVLMPPTAFLARPVRWLRAIEDYRGTLTASPNFGYELCARRLADRELEGLDLASLRLAFNGAEPVYPETLERFCARFAPYGFRPEAMTPVYGLAEAAVGLSFPPLGRGPHVDCIDGARMRNTGRADPIANAPTALRFVSCGAPLPGYQVRIVDEGRAEVPERIEGTLEFTGPSATTGYYHNPTATAGLRRGEWCDSGDRAYIANGEIYITGRVKDIIIRRGRHIYPEELEHAVAELDGVRKGCVVAFGTRAAETATERLVVLAETSENDPDLRGRLQTRINDRIIDCIGEPPEEVVLARPHTVLKTSSGKLRRAATRAAYEDGSLWRASASPSAQMLRLIGESALLTVRHWREAAARTAYGTYAWGVLLALGAPVFVLTLAITDRARAWQLNHRAAKWLIRACRLPLTVSRESTAELPAPHIIVTNHSSYLDSVFVAALLPAPHLFVAKRELEPVPVLGAYLKKLGTLFIERFAPVESVAEVERIQEAIARGNSVIIYPEGTFTREPGLRPFHLGAFQVAIAAGVPVIPLALRGTRNVLRDGEWLPRRTQVSAVVGRPLTARAGGDCFAAALSLRDAARTELLRHCGEPDLP